MDDELVSRQPSSTPNRRGRRYKPHELPVADGGRLVLRVDGTIEQLDAEGSTTHSWAADDPAWPDQAIRFGLHRQDPTITPPGRYVQGTKPPRG